MNSHLGRFALVTVAKINNIEELAQKLLAEGKVLSEAEIAEMSELPSKDALYSKVLGTMIAPITGLAVCLGQILEQMGGSVEAPKAEAAE